MSVKSLIGEKFGRLVVAGRAENRNKLSMWVCICDCGNEKVVQGGHLKSGHTKSCGCLGKELSVLSNTTHGMHSSKEYSSWSGMINRCRNKSHINYKIYGGKGIKVCDRWKKFENFYADMGKKPEGTSLDRIDNDGNYEPGNCRWATNRQQSRNRSDNHMVTIGSETKCFTDWADLIGISRNTIYNRIGRLGWTTEEALTIPKGGSREITA